MNAYAKPFWVQAMDALIGGIVAAWVIILMGAIARVVWSLLYIGWYMCGRIFGL